ncbi:unnamed protein product [Rhizophagus irregularis]|nr:unnamed protein product [Rhizophagus irregularis]
MHRVRGSQSSQSSGTSALTNLIGKKVVLNSPVIPEEGRPSDPMNVDPDSNVALMNVLLSGGEQRSSKTTGVAKKTSNQATNPNNSKNLDDSISSRDTSGQIQYPILEQASSTAQKRSNNSGESTEKSSSKKVKKAGEKKVSGTLKKLVKELSSETSQDSEVMEEGTGGFFDLYNTIINMEGQEEIAKRNVIKSYYNFGKALEDRYDHYKKNNLKRTAQALVNKEVRNQLPDSVSDDLLQKKKEWALKIFDLFSEIGEHMIQRIKSFSVASISKLSQDDIDHILQNNIYCATHHW